MNITNFLNASTRFWTGYLQGVARAIADEGIEPLSGSSIFLFPQSVLATATDSHLVMELVGARRNFAQLKPHKLRGIASLDQYFAQFPDSAGASTGIAFNSHHNGVSNIAFRSDGDEEELERRFPGIRERFLSTLVFDTNGATRYRPLSFSETSGFIYIENCLLVNRRAAAIRIRDIRMAIVVARETAEYDYISYLDETFRIVGGEELHGVQRLEGEEAEGVCVAGQFANIYLLGRLNETTLGAYIDRHRDILLRAFNARDVVSEPHLSWQIASPDPNETAINPDLFIQRQDGFWDVYDLKLPLLDRVRLTRGERRRRRFVDYVSEGIAQLAHYKQFLAVPEHRELAYERYGVRFDSPRFGLIVGNFENVNQAAIEEASRQLDKFELFDYDTILQLYLASFTNRSTSQTYIGQRKYFEQ